jgi:hypothetical protein
MNDDNADADFNNVALTEIHSALLAQNHMLLSIMLIIADIGIGILPEDSARADDIKQQVKNAVKSMKSIRGPEA